MSSARQIRKNLGHTHSSTECRDHRTVDGDRRELIIEGVLFVSIYSSDECYHLRRLRHNILNVARLDPVLGLALSHEVLHLRDAQEVHLFFHWKLVVRSFVFNSPMNKLSLYLLVVLLLHIFILMPPSISAGISTPQEFCSALVILRGFKIPLAYFSLRSSKSTRLILFASPSM